MRNNGVPRLPVVANGVGHTGPAMRSTARRSAIALLSLALTVLAGGQGWSEPATPPPAPAIEAIETAPAPDGPTQVIVGTYINDIQELDFKTNNYTIDLYV